MYSVGMPYRTEFAQSSPEVTRAAAIVRITEESSTNHEYV